MMDMLYVFLCTWHTSSVTVCSLKSWTGWQTCRLILSPPAHFLICARPHTLQIYISHTFHQPPALSQLQKMFTLSLTSNSRVSQILILLSTSFSVIESGKIVFPYCIKLFMSHERFINMKTTIKMQLHISRRKNGLGRANVIQPFPCCQIHTSDMQMELAQITSCSTEAFHLHPAIYFTITNLNI